MCDLFDSHTVTMQSGKPICRMYCLHGVSSYPSPLKLSAHSCTQDEAAVCPKRVANDAAGRRPSPPASQDRGCNSRFDEQRRSRARRRPSRNLYLSLWRGSSRLSQWRSKANRRTCHNLCLSQWRGSSSQWRRSPPFGQLRSSPRFLGQRSIPCFSQWRSRACR